MFLTFNFSLRFGQVGLNCHLPLRLSACADVAGYGFGITKTSLTTTENRLLILIKRYNSYPRTALVDSASNSQLHLAEQPALHVQQAECH